MDSVHRLTAGSRHIMKLKILSCEIFYRELCLLAATSTNIVDLEFLPKGLHDLGAAKMLDAVQAAVDRISAEGKYEAIPLGYGLCNNGLTGLVARSIPLVVPKAHDCITMFLGSRHRYTEFFHANPGTYFLTSGWIERGGIDGDLKQATVAHSTGMDQSLEQLIEKYGEENAKYIYETLCDTLHNYTKFAYIEMGIEPDARYEEHARREAAKRGWEFSKTRGDMEMLRRLVEGDWNSGEFLIVPPGSKIKAIYDGDILEIEPA